MTALVLLIAVCAAAVPLGVTVYEHPRNALLMCGVLPVVGWHTAHGLSVNISMPVLAVLGFMALWATVRCCLAFNPRIAVPELLIWLAVVGLSVCAVSAAPVKTILTVLALFGCAHSVVIILQILKVKAPLPGMVGKYRFAFFDKAVMVYQPVGFAGNTNYAGLFLVPCIFAAAVTGLWPAMLLLIPGLLLTRCKVAIFAVVTAALCFVSWLLAAVVFVLMLLAGRHSNTWKFRLRYWKVALATIRIDWPIGLGFNCWKCIVSDERIRAGDNKPHIKTKLNGKQKEVWMHQPRRCHNDYLQAVLNGGIPWLLMYLFVIGSALYLSDGWMRCGVVALAICGLGFHNMSMPVLMVPFWLFLLCACTGQPWAVYSSVYLPFALMFAAPVIIPFTSRLMADYFLHKAITKPDTALESLTIAETVDPYNAFVRYRRAMLDYNEDRVFDAFRRITRIIDDNDGELSLGPLYGNLGALYRKMTDTVDFNEYDKLAEHYKGC